VIELLLQAERAMSVGLTDRAGALYAQIAEADPQNSIAVVGLARVALEHGDEAGARALARRALTIDPENAAAARLVERLDEVLRYRVAESAAAPEPRGPAAEPHPSAEPLATPVDPAPIPMPATPPPERRSWLDRLFRRR
jgi:hypothetical protein